MLIKKTILFSIIILITCSVFSQDTLPLNDTKRNIIRWDITPMVILNHKSIVIGYERVLKPWQTFSINAGYLEISPFTNSEGEPIQIADQHSRGGFDISIDYRFYSKNRNKYHAPDGLYWGPYLSFNTLRHEASLGYSDADKNYITVTYNSRFSIFNAGLQLGYQFVFKNNITIDLILMGPSFSIYDLNMNLGFSTEIDIDDPFYEELKYFLENHNGIIAQLLKNQEFDHSGKLTFPYYGYRYAFQIGYRF